MLAASFNYTEPPFYVILLGTMGLIALLVFFGWMRRIILGMFGGGLGAATIAWYVISRGSGDDVTRVLMYMVGVPACGVVGAILCACSGLVGKFVRRKNGNGNGK